MWCRRNVGPSRYDVRISSLSAAIAREEGHPMSTPDDYGPARPGLLPDGARDAGLRDADRDAGLRDADRDAGLRDADLEWAEYVAWLDRECAAGRDPEPESWPEVWPSGYEESRSPDPDDPDFAGPAPIGPAPIGPAPIGPAPIGPAPIGPAPIGPAPIGPAPAGSVSSGPGRLLFAGGGAGDLMPPSPFLAALTEQAVSDVAGLSDEELVGVLRASRRLAAREEDKQALAGAELGRRRRAAFEAALARGVPAGCAAGGFPGEELSIELTVSRAEAGHLIDDAIDLTSRLPRTLAGMAAGLIDADRAGWIALYTRSLSPADAAYADEVLAAVAPGLRVDQLARKAAALEKKLNPEGGKARRERARRDEQRVEVRRELSGNASLSGREMDTGDVLAAKAHIDAIAARLRRGGLPGTLGSLRVLALADLTQGRDPLDRLRATYPDAPKPPGPPDSPESPESPPAGPAAPQTPNLGFPSRPVPLPALVNIIIPVGTLLGWSTTPAQASGWGLLDHDEARTVAEAAARHPRTRWCATITDPGGTAIAHGCATGQYPRLLRDLQPQPPSDQEPPAPAH